MSRIDKLIADLCPDGVEYKTLGELGIFLGGLSGKSKEDFKDGNAKFITYMNVFCNIQLNLNVTDTVRISEGEKQNTIQYGDILFTGSSETPDECGMSSVLTVKTEEKLYLNSFCFIYRFNDSELFLPAFSKYVFRSDYLRKQIIKTASGVTRFNVSKAKMAKVTVPVPPLEVQAEIVRILDNFTELTADLTAELTARKKQYEYYRDYLLDFGKNGRVNQKVEWRTLGEVCNIIVGGEAPDDCIKGEERNEVYKYPVWANGQDVYGYAKEYKIDSDAVCISSIGANTGAVFFHHKYFTPIIRLKVLVPKICGISIRYLFHAVSVIDFAPKKSSVPNMSSSDIKKAKIPVPPLEVQERIVAILDRFDKLCNDLSEGLPAEIEARRKQYEYYRDKLLSFS